MGDKFRKGLPRPPGAGRKTGISVNKTTALAKEIICGTFDKLGGIERLVKWAEKNDTNLSQFYTRIWVRIIPAEVTGVNGGPIQLEAVEREQLRGAILEAASTRVTDEDTEHLH